MSHGEIFPLFTGVAEVPCAGYFMKGAAISLASEVSHEASSL